jgi:hypothetical protein
MKQRGAKIIAKKRFATYLQHHSKVQGVVKSKLYHRCCKGFLLGFYIFNMNMYGNVNQGMDDVIYIQRVFMIFKRLIAGGIFNFIDTQ